MAWTGFGGSWNDGVHSGGDDSGSIGGGGIKLDGNGNPVGTKAPSASDIAAQFNSYGGTQISPSQVTNIGKDDNGGYQADIAGAYHTVSVDGNSKYSNTVAGFTGVSNPSSNGGSGKNGGVSNWNDAANLIRSGKIPANFKLQGSKIGIMVTKYKKMSTGHGESVQLPDGKKFVEVPALTKAYNEGLTEREAYTSAIKMTADFYKEIGAKYGAQQAAIAKELEAASKGKPMKNVDQAMAAFSKNKAILDANLSTSNREAIANALKAVDRSKAAKQMVAFGKAFGIVGITMDMYDLLASLQTSIKTNNWRPFFVKAESMLLAKEAGVLTAWAFSIMLGTPLGIIGYAVIMAAVSALVNEALVNKVVNTITH